MIPKYRFQQYYYPVRLLYKALSLRDSIRKTPIIIVYQMAKVGSSTVVASLHKSNLDMPIYHIHALTKEGLKNEESSYYGPEKDFFCKSLLPVTTHVFEGHYVRDIIKSGTRKIKVVTLVRDPVARNISAFFEGMELRVANFHDRVTQNAITAEELIDLFLKSISTDPEYHLTPLRWFDREFKNALNIDVYDKDFPKSTGYQLFENRNTAVLLLKLEKLNECFSQAASAFFDKKPISIESKNVANKKIYQRLYKEFLQSIALPDEYLDSMYNSKFARHFYSENEIDSFIQRWTI